MKGTFLPPDVEDTDKYKLRKFLFQDKIEPDDVIFGHKIFHLPTFRLVKIYCVGAESNHLRFDLMTWVGWLTITAGTFNYLLKGIRETDQGKLTYVTNQS